MEMSSYYHTLGIPIKKDNTGGGGGGGRATVMFWYASDKASV